MALNIEPVAEETAPPPAAPEVIAVELGEPFRRWLLARAAAHGRTPAEEIAARLRDVWRDDPWRQMATGGLLAKP